MATLHLKIDYYKDCKDAIEESYEVNNIGDINKYLDPFFINYNRLCSTETASYSFYVFQELELTASVIKDGQEYSIIEFKNMLNHQN